MFVEEKNVKTELNNNASFSQGSILSFVRDSLFMLSIMLVLQLSFASINLTLPDGIEDNEYLPLG